MKRDMDLVREILLACETVPEGEPLPDVPKIEGHSSVEVAYHVHLMGQAGLLKVADTTFMEHTSPRAAILEVTWKGHEFSEAAQSSVVWNSSKDMMKKTGAAGLDVMLGVLKAIGKQKLREFGIDLGGA